MFCNRCGAENPDDAAYCSNCGASVGLSAPATSGPPPPPPGSKPVPLPPPPPSPGPPAGRDVPAPPPGTITYTAAAPGRSVRGLTIALVVLFSIAAGLATGQVGARLYMLSVLDDHADGAGTSPEAVADVDDAYTAAEALQAVAMLLALAILVLLVVWTWRARSNVDTWGATGARLPTGMAVGAWFIPFFWYLGPYWSMSDAYKAADPSLPPGGDLRARPRCRLALAWWTVWSVANALLWVGELALTAVADTFGSGEGGVGSDLTSDVDAARAATGVLAAGEALLVVAAVLGLLAVRRMGARQQERLEPHRAPAVAPR